MSSPSTDSTTRQAPPSIGLCLSGGGSRGAFTVGVLQYLAEVKGLRQFRVIAGTSSGALIGALVAADAYADLIHIYTNVKTLDVLRPPVSAVLGLKTAFLAALAMNRPSLFGDAGLKHLIETFLSEQRWRGIVARASRTELILSAVDFQTGTIARFSNRTHDIPTLRQALNASCNIPVMMPVVEIDSGDGLPHQYCDGGLVDLTPLSSVLLAETPVDRIISIATMPEGFRHETPRIDNAFEALLATLEIYSVDVFHNDTLMPRFVNAIIALKEALGRRGWADVRRVLPRPVRRFLRRELKSQRYAEILTIAPKTPLPFTALEFKPEHMREARLAGFSRAAELLGEIDLTAPVDFGCRREFIRHAKRRREAHRPARRQTQGFNRPQGTPSPRPRSGPSRGRRLPRRRPH